MKPFIYSILFLFVFNSTFSQTEEVILRKSFEVNSNTVLNLDLDNVAILFEESTDGKIHFDYTMKFGRYSKRKREIIKKQAKVKVSKKNDLINLTVTNSMFVGINHKTYFTMDSLTSAIKGYMETVKKKKYVYKTKDSLLKEIKYSEGNNLEDFLKKNKKKYQDDTSYKNKKVIIKEFVIKIPKNVSIRLKALHSNITFNYELTKPLIMNTFKGVFRFKKITAKENIIISSNGIFMAEKVENGRIEFLDMSKVLIGDISNLNIATETSRIQIGEIGKNVNINDFNSKIYLYNFSENFNSFDLKGDYSKLSFYNIMEENYSLNVYGHNTVLNMNNIKASFGLSKDKKLDKILEKKVKVGKVSNGNIAIELRNVILNIK